MKERPILFSGPMVRAILAGQKTHTRRVVKPQPYFRDRVGLTAPGWCWESLAHLGPKLSAWSAGEFPYELAKHCPYGWAGDRLWVRETWRGGSNSLSSGLHYRADPDEQEAPGQWKPSIHMPRWASRITLEVTEVRVQRVQEISDEDAKAEGVPEPLSLTEEEIAGMEPGPTKELAKALGPGQFTSKFEFEMLWQSINAKRGYSWESNPWVWAITFRRLA